MEITVIRLPVKLFFLIYFSTTDKDGYATAALHGATCDTRRVKTTALRLYHAQILCKNKPLHKRK